MKEKPVRTNIMLSPELDNFLDGQVSAVRQANGDGINRSAFIRALLAALNYSGVDLARYGIHTEAQAAGFLTAVLRAGRQAMQL